MRERERLDDFEGGAVACRGCKRLLYFDMQHLAPQRCCAYAYVPSQRQIDLLIYDKLGAEDFADAQALPPPTPVLLDPPYDEYDEQMGESDSFEEVPISDEEVDILAVTAEQVVARKEERLAQLKRRG